MSIENETSLKAPSLRTMLLPLMVALFIWEEPGIPLILDFVGLPSETWIVEMWKYFWDHSYPAYAKRFADIFGLIALVGGFLMFWVDDQFVKELQLTRGLLGLVTGDTTAIISLTAFSVGAAIIVDYPLAPVPIFHGIVIVFLYFAFVRIHTLVPSLLELPESTTSWSTKVITFVTIFVLCGIVTGLAVILMQSVEYCSIVGCVL